MRFNPLELVVGAFSSLVLGMVIHPAFALLAVVFLAIWAMQFLAFLFR